MRRIVSLVPSLTETVATISGSTDLVGVTSFCTHPLKDLKHAKIVGGTKDPDLDLIARLSPTHILANLEENTPEVLDSLKNSYPILITKPSAVSHVPPMLRDMARFLCDENYMSQANELEVLMNEIQSPVILTKAYYFIWKSPWMIAGDDTYIKDAMKWLGFELVQPILGRYPQVDLNQLDETIPKFFSTEPWPFRKRDLEDMPVAFRKRDLCFKIDGKLMSWYGTTTINLLRKIHQLEQSKVYEQFKI